MLLLDEILSTHFLDSKRADILHLLNKYDLINSLGRITNELETHLEDALKSNTIAPISIISSMSSSALVMLNNHVITIKDSGEKRRIQEVISQIGIRLILSIVKMFPEEAIKILEAIKSSLRNTSKLFNYDFNEVELLLGFDQVELTLNTISGKLQSQEINKIRNQKLPYIVWTKKTNVDFLLHELKIRNWIKSKNDFSKLFGNNDSDLTVSWNVKHTCELANLLYRLHRLDFIRPMGTRGYFSIAEKHIIGFSGEGIKRDSLKKLSSKMTNTPEHYATITNEINLIISQISKD